jgi:hypothetical protein
MNIECPYALSINLTCDKFWIPEGGKMFLYTSDKKQSIGAFTSKNNKGDKNNLRGFATELLYSDRVTIEYYQPKEVTDEAVISISNVVHGYRQLRFNVPGSGTSGDCQVNINCSEGQSWQNEKKAVALIFEEGHQRGSGSLVTTINNAPTPYFLTANHCINNGHDALSLPNLDYWVFYWNHEVPGCERTNYIPPYHTTSGAMIKANNNISDFALLLLDEDPREIVGYNPYYLGWDASGNTGGCGVCIHHPNRDVKKISTVASTPVSTEYEGYTPGNNYTYWKVNWASTENGYGTTEVGSSGSPLLNSSHRIIGQLYGGRSNCSDQSLPDWFGKFSVSWTGNGDPSICRRLNHWLDPDNSGALTKDGAYNCSIEGPDFVCDSSVYVVNNLPSGYTVEWVFPTYSDPKPKIKTDNPAVNCCMIVNKYKYPSVDTLKAIIKYNNVVQEECRKVVISDSPGFYGTYKQEACSYYGVNHPAIYETTLAMNTPYFVHMGCTVTLQSNKFKTHPVSYSGPTPSYWAVDTNVGKVYFQLPLGTSGMPFNIQLGGCFNENKSLLFFAMTNNGNMSSTNSLVITSTGNIYKIALVENIEEYNGIPDEYREDYLKQKAQNNMDNTVGQVEIYDGQTGRKMVAGTLSDSRYQLDTTGWASGVYVVRVVRGDEVYTEKIHIK